MGVKVEHAIHAVFNVASGKIYFVRYLFHIHVPKMRFSAGIQNFMPQNSFLGTWRSVFWTQEFLGAGCYSLPGRTFQGEHFALLITLSLVLTGSSSIFPKSGHFRLPGSANFAYLVPTFELIFLN